MKKGLFITLFFIVGCHPAPTLSTKTIAINPSHRAVSFQPRISQIVIHYTVADEARSLSLLTGNHVSSHYLIAAQPSRTSPQPEVYQLVPEDQAAWHAGASYWRGTQNLNHTSIGIELVNGGFRTGSYGESCQLYSSAQIETLIVLLQQIVQRYAIKPENIVGHSDIAANRKQDPGPCFPWQQLAKHGLGAWPDPQRVNQLLAGHMATATVDNKILLPLLKQYGYFVPRKANQVQAQQLVRAFQMHFQPENISGQADQLTLARLKALLEQYPRQH